MPGEKIEANYEMLENIVNIFNERHETLMTMMSHLKNTMEALRADGWMGKGSDGFYSEMTDVVLPRLSRLIEALAQSGQTTRQISSLMNDAEEQAGALFRGE